MTTIACDGKAMAGDGLISSGGTAYGMNCRKVRRLKDGRIAGCAGSAFSMEVFFKWLDEGGDAPDLDENFDALVLDLDGICRNYDAKCLSIVEELPTTIGSGRELALGAMLAGAGPEQAVAIAAARDLGTGGTVYSLALGDDE